LDELVISYQLLLHQLFPSLAATVEVHLFHLADVVDFGGLSGKTFMAFVFTYLKYSTAAIRACGRPACHPIIPSTDTAQLLYMQHTVTAQEVKVDPRY
jgi:hypothetical protein